MEETIYAGYQKGTLTETIFGMSGVGHEKGTEVLYKLIDGYYHYVNPINKVLVKTAKFCV